MGKKYRTERRRIDARRVHVVIHNQDAVEYYKKHPNGTYGRLLGQQRGTALRRPRPRREAGRLGGESPDRRCCRQGAQDRCRLPGRRTTGAWAGSGHGCPARHGGATAVRAGTLGGGAMTEYTADHRAISACACVYRRLREVDRLLTEARDHVLDATAALEDPADACRAVELLRLAGQK